MNISLLSAVQVNSVPILSQVLRTTGPGSQDLEAALFHACQEGLTDCVRCLLQQGLANPNARTASGYTPLYLATREGRHEVVELLCEAGAALEDMLYTGSSALHEAARMGRDDCLRVLVERGCSTNIRDSSCSTALMLAVRGKHYLVIRQLLQAGCDVNLQDKQGRTALHFACHTAVAVDQLLRSGADANIRDEQGCTPLLVAASEGLNKVVHSLCGWPGIDVNIPNMSVLKTPLHLLAYKGHSGCVKDLISAGADTNLLDLESRSPLWYAVVNGKRDIVALLLRTNGHVDSYQCPPQHPIQACPVRLAIERRHLDILKMFILTGYDNQHLRECLQMTTAQALFAENQVTHWLNHAQGVMSLQQICRRWLRHHLGFHLFMDLSRLPLPDKLKSYVSLVDLEETVAEC